MEGLDIMKLMMMSSPACKIRFELETTRHSFDVFAAARMNSSSKTIPCLCFRKYSLIFLPSRNDGEPSLQSQCPWSREDISFCGLIVLFDETANNSEERSIHS